MRDTDRRFLSVRPSVRLSVAMMVLCLLYISSKFFYHLVGPYLYFFFCLKRGTKFERYYPKLNTGGRKYLRFSTKIAIYRVNGTR